MQLNLIYMHYIYITYTLHIHCIYTKWHKWYNWTQILHNAYMFTMEPNPRKHKLASGMICPCYIA